MDKTQLRDMLNDIIEDAYVVGQTVANGADDKLDEVLSVHMARFSKALSL